MLDSSEGVVVGCGMPTIVSEPWAPVNNYFLLRGVHLGLRLCDERIDLRQQGRLVALHAEALLADGRAGLAASQAHSAHLSLQAHAQGHELDVGHFDGGRVGVCHALRIAQVTAGATTIFRFFCACVQPATVLGWFVGIRLATARWAVCPNPTFWMAHPRIWM